jgi:hypothetical protein
VFPIGVLYRNENAERYDKIAARGIELGREERMSAIQREIDRFLI